LETDGSLAPLASLSVVLATPATARSIRSRGRRLLGLLPPLLVLAAWQVAWDLELKPRTILPSPHQVLTASDAFFFGKNQVTLSGIVPFKGAAWLHISASLERCVTTWVLAVLVGLLVGLGLGLSHWVADLVEPLSNALRAVPIFAWLPLTAVLFGIGEPPARILIFIGALWPVVVATTDSVARVPRAQVETARMLGTPRSRLWRRVYLPCALPEIVTGLRLSLTLAWTCVIVGELLGVSRGIGAMMISAREAGNTDQIIVGIFLFAGIGYAGDRLLRLLTRPLVRWSDA
jgi:ABC-type nitrate/sulfonate/bicarbonate transport system permease component